MAYWKPLRVASRTVFGLSTLTIWGLVIGYFSVGACSGRSQTPGSAGSEATNGSIATNTDKFPHSLHSSDNKRFTSFEGRGLGCVDCHSLAEVEAGKPPRPGSNEHAPCDACHAEEFMKPPGQFCRICHESVNVTTPGASTMRPFPAPGKQRVLPSSFSHKAHLNKGLMEKQSGFHLSCNDCHSKAKDGQPTLPRHAECARCHNGKVKAAVPMENCADCHASGNADIAARSISFNEGLTFSHKTHQTDRAGAKIACKDCHASVMGSSQVEDLSLPTMQQCATCHQDPARSPEKVRIAQCQVCHPAMTSGNPPRSHLSGSLLPENHTLDFRTNHADQAADTQANCQYCHENLSGDSRDSCYQCHEIMRPKDHMLGWHNETHGREASVDRNRCATCHQVDYCTACHSIPPRSHQPMGTFRLGGHAQAARFGLSSCTACHTIEDTCASCHREVQ